jgi:SAM-dependent methyltransferase
MTDKDLQTNYLIECLAPKRGEVILDVGCGTGSELERILRTSHVRSVVGLDSWDKQIAVAKRRLSRYVKRGVAELRVGDAGQRLPFPSKSFHAVLAVELMECLGASKQKRLLQEMHRVLKPGGRVLVEHTDWDTQVWNASDRSLERTLVHAFCDWKQDWMESSDGWMGRRLSGLLRQSKLFKNVRVEIRVVSNDRYTTQTDGYDRSLDLLELAKNVRRVSGSEVRRFLSDLRRLDRTGAYFYSVNRYIVLAKKR